jgi:hypothetical protein
VTLMILTIKAKPGSDNPITYDRYVFPTPADNAELNTKPLKIRKAHVLL